MSDLAYFEYAAVIRPQGNQLEGTPAHYLVEVAIHDPVTGEERDEEELKKLANNFLALALFWLSLLPVRKHPRIR
jgi:hypothetical protein